MTRRNCLGASTLEKSQVCSCFPGEVKHMPSQKLFLMLILSNMVTINIRCLIQVYTTKWKNSKLGHSSKEIYHQNYEESLRNLNYSGVWIKDHIKQCLINQDSYREEDEHRQIFSLSLLKTIPASFPAHLTSAPQMRLSQVFYCGYEWSPKPRSLFPLIQLPLDRNLKVSQKTNKNEVIIAHLFCIALNTYKHTPCMTVTSTYFVKQCFYLPKADRYQEAPLTPLHSLSVHRPLLLIQLSFYLRNPQLNLLHLLCHYSI